MTKVTVTFETTEEIKRKVVRIIDDAARKSYLLLENISDEADWELQYELSDGLTNVVNQIEQGGK